jgi:hypothetical protein
MSMSVNNCSTCPVKIKLSELDRDGDGLVTQAEFTLQMRLALSNYDFANGKKDGLISNATGGLISNGDDELFYFTHYAVERSGLPYAWRNQNNGRNTLNVHNASFIPGSFSIAAYADKCFEYYGGSTARLIAAEKPISVESLRKKAPKWLDLNG